MPATVALVLWLRRLRRWSLLAPGSVFADIATFFSKLAVLTFGGAYAVLAWVAQEAVGTYGWLEPGEMLDGLGMAETTPGPLIMVLAVRGLHGRFARGGLGRAAAGGKSGRAAGHLGHLRALLCLDFPRRALHGAAARKQGAVGGPVCGDGGCRGRHPEPCDLVRDPCHLARGHAGRGRAAVVELPVMGSMDWAAAALSALALVAVFRLKLGMAAVLAGAAALGLVLHLVGLA